MAFSVHIKAAKDLVTSLDATKDGFILQARAKIAKARPFVADATRLWGALRNATHLTDILGNAGIRNDLLAAVGFSDEALNNVPVDVADTVLRATLDRIFNEASESWREAILYRYLFNEGRLLRWRNEKPNGSACATEANRCHNKGVPVWG